MAVSGDQTPPLAVERLKCENTFLLICATLSSDAEQFDI